MLHSNTSVGDEEEEGREKKRIFSFRMAMDPRPERSSSLSSKPLHNFNLLGLRWGSQKYLRCMKVNNSPGQISGADRRPPPSPSSHSVILNNGISNGSDTRAGVIGKRKERESFDDPSSLSPADFRGGSDGKKSGPVYKSPFRPLPPASMSTEYGGRKIRLPPENGDDGDGIAAVREKLMIDLQTETYKIKVAIFKEGLEPDEEENEGLPSPAAPVTVSPSAVVTVADTETSAAVAADEALRPWNLRSRRAACKAPTMPNGYSFGGAGTSNGNGGSSPGKALNVELMKPVSGLSPLRVGTENNTKSPRLRSGAAATPTAAAPASNEGKEKAKFSAALSRHEIEEDFMTIAGRKPPRRPQKRPKHVQKSLDTLFPGLWLSEITADMYKVPETQ